jgi:hypothetical protein
MISVQAKGVGGWRVVGHVDECVLAQVSFTVSEAGRQRVLRDRVKNVHAYVAGVLIAQMDDSIVAPLRLGYDPYRHRSFVERESQRAIVCCSHLVVRDNVVWVSADALKVTRLAVQPQVKRSPDEQMSLLDQWWMMQLA